MNKLIKPAVIAVGFGLALSVSAANATETAEKVAVCAGCHGAEGRSAVPDNPILASQHESYLLAALQAYVKDGRDHGIMKTMASRLSTDDMAEITAYYAAQPAYQSAATPVGDATRGKAKTAACAGCHGAEGRSENPMFPKLAGQHAVYLSKALQAYKSGARENAMMAPGMLEPMSDQDIDDIAAYFSSQNPEPAADGEKEEGNQ
jgi:cytochrome c553